MYHQVNKKLPFNYVDLGHQQLKNIADPVRVFQIDSTTQASSSLNVKRKRDERPSIAVLPFNNISGDQEQQYLSDGIATIVATIEGRAATTGLAQVRRTPLKNWAAYDFYLEGRDNIMQYKMDEAGSLFAQSIELDPTFAQAQAAMPPQ